MDNLTQPKPAGPESDALVVAKLDRLSRSVLDFGSITELARRQGWAVVALDVDVDMTTPTGELTANVTSAVAQWERRIIGARTSDALQAMKAQGTRLGRPVTLLDETRQRIATDRAHGQTLRAIADTLNSENVPTARRTLARLNHPACTRLPRPRRRGRGRTTRMTHAHPMRGRDSLPHEESP